MPSYQEQLEEIKENLYKRVYLFMVGNRVSCEDAVYQCDWMIENTYEFIGDLFKIIEPNLPLTQYED